MFSDRTNWKLAHNRFTQALDEVRAAGASILDLTLSNPTRAGLQYDERAILGALASRQALDYDPQPKGLRQARENGGFGWVHHYDFATRFDNQRCMIHWSNLDRAR